MEHSLSARELGDLFKTVFALGPADRRLVIHSDWPQPGQADSDDWRWRRALAGDWAAKLASPESGLALPEVWLLAYPSVGSSGRDLPPTLRRIQPEWAKDDWASLEKRGTALSLEEALDRHTAIISATEYSTTAPLKMLAKKRLFRGNTMPGLTPAMVPALKLDYHRIHQRVMQFCHLLEEWDGLEVIFTSSGGRQAAYFDLRFRPAHASSGLQKEPGEVGNLPSGEAYLAPYEGEKPGEPSRTQGILPVQLGQEIVLFEIQGNRAVRVKSRGEKSAEQARLLAEEPAYGNIAEVGLGVLGEFGICSVGAVLLDEKLGLHIAFGRSEHFGGITSPAAFKDPKKVVHLDWVYVPSLQPQVAVAEARLTGRGKTLPLMKDGRYLI